MKSFLGSSTIAPLLSNSSSSSSTSPPFFFPNYTLTFLTFYFSKGMMMIMNTVPRKRNREKNIYIVILLALVKQYLV
jgi:hypothetical protein